MGHNLIGLGKYGWREDGYSDNYSDHYLSELRLLNTSSYNTSQFGFWWLVCKVIERREERSSKTAVLGRKTTNCLPYKRLIGENRMELRCCKLMGFYPLGANNLW